MLCFRDESQTAISVSFFNPMSPPTLDIANWFQSEHGGISGWSTRPNTFVSHRLENIFQTSNNVLMLPRGILVYANAACFDPLRPSSPMSVMLMQCPMKDSVVWYYTTNRLDGLICSLNESGAVSLPTHFHATITDSAASDAVAGQESSQASIHSVLLELIEEGFKPHNSIAVAQGSSQLNHATTQMTFARNSGLVDLTMEDEEATSVDSNPEQALEDSNANDVSMEDQEVSVRNHGSMEAQAVSGNPEQALRCSNQSRITKSAMRQPPHPPTDRQLRPRPSKPKSVTFDIPTTSTVPSKIMPDNYAELLAPLRPKYMARLENDEDYRTLSAGERLLAAYNRYSSIQRYKEEMHIFFDEYAACEKRSKRKTRGEWKEWACRARKFGGRTCREAKIDQLIATLEAIGWIELAD